MKYFVSRDDREYGPYTMEELRTYVAQQRIGAADPVREAGAGGRTFTSVAEALAAAENEAVGSAPPPFPPPPPPGAGASPYAAPATWQSLGGAAAGGRADTTIPMPNDQTWVMVLLLSLVTCGIYSIIRMFQQASYAKKVDPGNQATAYYLAYLGIYFVSVLMTVASKGEGSVIGTLLSLGAGVSAIVGTFKVRAALQVAFNRPLSGVMTFFFNVLYFQYHMHDVATAMKAGRRF
jgi:hypothetical protein